MNKFKKMCSLLIGSCLLFSLTVPTFAIASYTQRSSNIFNVSIPENAHTKVENGMVVYCNFFDINSGYQYAFFNPTNNTYYRYKERTATDFATTEKYIIHDYEFSTTSSVNGMDNGVTFEVPAISGYVQGDAKIVSMSTGENHTDDYDSYQYTVELRTTNFFSKTLCTRGATAGNEFVKSFESSSDVECYLYIIANDRLNGADLLQGSGSVYYFG